MKKIKKPSDITIELMGLAKNLRDLADHVSMLEKENEERPEEFCKDVNVHCITDYSQVYRHREQNAGSGGLRKIIPFAGPSAYLGSSPKPYACLAKPDADIKPLLGIPGDSLTADIPDCRPLLQRDGLILLAWDKRVTESGELFTAYWVTSIDVPRFYASKRFFLKDFPSACPDRKSYAAEDGIEYYGQSAPAYLVHVAPELMKSNPRHRELRDAHIKTLKHLGSKVNFNYKYLLYAEKKKGAFKKSS